MLEAVFVNHKIIADVTVIDQTISHYRILEKLGSGGMGEVYKAEDTKLKRVVALKFLPAELTRDPHSKERFIEEARAASALDHANICTIHGIDETPDGQLFIVMAYYEGVTLKNKLKNCIDDKTSSLTLINIIDISIQISQGMEKAHEKGIVHRDIKPGNVILTVTGQVKILDFGLAMVAGESMIIRNGIMSGTIAYMSPEQVEGETVDFRSDIWSFGVLLYEMLCGKLPFRGESDQAIIYSILHEYPEPIGHLYEQIPEQLGELVFKCLSENPASRFQGFSEIIGLLVRIQRGLEAGVSHVSPVINGMKPSIAILPFANISGDPEQEYFCDGLAEELINMLAQIEGLRVVARTSSFAFKGKSDDIRSIGLKLNVETVLEGSIRKTGDRLRITVQLINVSDGFHKWSERYERQLSDIFTIQDEISLNITEKLKIHMLGKEAAAVTKQYTANVEAYQMYLRGNFLLNRMTDTHCRKAIEYFNKAIANDSNYSLPYWGISRGYFILGMYFYVNPKEVFPLAGKAAIRALEIDDTLWQAKHTLTALKFIYDWDWKGAREGYEQLLKTNPSSSLLHYSYGLYWGIMGRLERTIAELKFALEIDPLSTNYYLNLALWLRRMGRFQEARQELNKCLELSPDHPWIYWINGNIFVAEFRYDEGADILKKALKLSRNFPPILSSLAWLYARAGNVTEAEKILHKLNRIRLTRYVGSFQFAKIYSALGDKDRAFEFLNQALEERDVSLLHILTDDATVELRTDSRFKHLLTKMKLDYPEH